LVSLPNARSKDPAIDRDSTSREGRLADTSVPELLARAYREALTGSLMLVPIDAAASTVRFVDGSVVDAAGPWRTSKLEWGALGRLLPEDSLEFAARHAEEYGVDPFSAVQRLALLPDDGIAAARQSLTVLGVRMLCELAGDVRYAFVAPTAGLDARSEAASALEPLGLIMASFLVGSQGERAARSLAPFEHATLTLDVERAKSLLPTLQGPVRAILDCLVVSPGSVQALRDRGLVSSDELVASVCALWITRVLNVRGHAGSQTFPAVRPSSGAPRAPQAPTTSSPPTLQPPVTSRPPAIPSIESSLPPRRDSGFVRAVHGALDAGAKEHAMELKVEEAWMRAEADPARAQQITAVVSKAVTVFPKNPRMHYCLARLHMQANRVDEAVQELEIVLSLDPNDKQADADLAALRSRRGESGGSS
jgi:hypothetical protein